ncbi:cyclase family protein [Nonomuraea sp. NPDC050556]|uniref:cyclase family protein n=1 Tax=Nonomuraea sp. NPDC050556 TaxID=3364369 RepID=UPI0037B252C4
MRRRQAFSAATGMVGAVLGGKVFADASESEHPFRQVRLVNLSHVNDPATTSGFPGDPAFTLKTAFTIPKDGYYLQYVKEGEHTGTHWGAPGHMNQGQVLADQMDPDDFFLPAVRIDIRDKAAHNADYALTVGDLKAWEKEHGPIPRGSAIILWTGWEAKWGTAAYANLDAKHAIHQPGFSVDAVKWLIAKGRLAERGALGSDTFGPDLGTDETYAVSMLLYHEHRISLENLANLGELPTRGAWILVGGVINRRGSGSPATIYGLIPRARQ